MTSILTQAENQGSLGILKPRRVNHYNYNYNANLNFCNNWAEHV